MVEFLQQNGLLVLIGCLVLLLLFFMMVAAAAIFVARLSGHSLLGPVLGSMLRTMSVKNDADNEDIEDHATPPPHRHFDVNQIKEQSAYKLDFDQAVEKYRDHNEPPQEQGGGYAAEAVSPRTQPLEAIDTPPSAAADLPLTPLVTPFPDAAELPLTPIGPPQVDTLAASDLPLTPLVTSLPAAAEPPLPPIAPPPGLPEDEPPAHTLGTGGGDYATPESGFSPLPPRPPTLPGQRLDDTAR